MKKPPINPTNYDAIPTYADDGDPTDVLVLGAAPTFSGCLLQVRILGAVLLKKDGVVNNRLVACPKKTPGVALSSDAFKDIDDVPNETLAGIERFLMEYSGVEGNKIQFDGTCSRKKALAMIEHDRKQFKRQSDKSE